ncbi:MAG: hypothetical protein M3R67_14530 [Acidobacteriota bacterium]|nr:hypothetical protein [Acidobacteriota bacterium]
MINKVIGGNTPEKHVQVNLIINLVTSIISGLLLVFLIGYYDGHYQRTHESTPPIIYLVYIFLGLVSAWQLLSFVIAVKLKSKLGGRKGREISTDSSVKTPSLSARRAQDFLPQTNFEDIQARSVTEDYD